MTTEEFNEKWEAYLEDGHYGLDISTPEVVEYLDEEFKKLSLIPGFSYSQIKEKFGMARVYLSFGFSEEAHEMENEINKIFKQIDESK
jgi:alpha-galactosidase